MKCIFILFAIGCAGAVDWDVVTDLDTYVNSPESVYSYQLIDTQVVTGATVYTLNMTSLTWFDETVTTTPIWWHWQVIVVPDVVTREEALLSISAGSNSNTDSPPGILSLGTYIDFSVRTGAVSSLLEMVPNQPIQFVDDEFGEGGRVEDSIIGYSWRLFIQETITDPAIIANFPMTKASKLAVDTMIDFTASLPEPVTVSRVMPTGYSKRGWAAWLLGCVDRRVFAIAPVVFDLLDFVPNLEHHFRSMGGWSFAFAPYRDAGAAQYLYHPRTEIIASYIDPLSFNERLTMTKIIQSASGDQFFLPDGTDFWEQVLNGDNYYMLYENEGHVMTSHNDEQWENVEAFFVAILDDFPLPQYSWSKSENPERGTITINLQTEPTVVTKWHANNTERVCEDDNPLLTCRRDFRTTRDGFPSSTLIEWTPELLSATTGIQETSEPQRNDYGQTIFHVAMTFPGPDGRFFRVSTGSNIITDIFPYPPCQSELECYGVLV